MKLLHSNLVAFILGLAIMFVAFAFESIVPLGIGIVVWVGYWGFRKFTE